MGHGGRIVLAMRLKTEIVREKPGIMKKDRSCCMVLFLTYIYNPGQLYKAVFKFEVSWAKPLWLQVEYP